MSHLIYQNTLRKAQERHTYPARLRTTQEPKMEMKQSTNWTAFLYGPAKQLCLSAHKVAYSSNQTAQVTADASPSTVQECDHNGVQ